MSSITNIFSNLNYLTKNELDKNNDEKKIMNNFEESMPSLKQGNEYTNYQNKIIINLEESNEINEIEGFEGINLNNLNLTADGLAKKSNTIIKNNDYSSQQQIIANLRLQYDKTLKEYEKIIATINNTTTGYIDRVNPSNPYLGKNIRFTTGQICYVSQQGVVKWYPNNDIYKSTSGLNGCPSSSEVISINLPWLSEYNSPGITIPSIPPLITGTPMVKGQSCGNEGKNIFVNTLMSHPDVKYIGCYADDENNHLMKFIGGQPVSTSYVSLQNGNFDQPQIANNSYKYINSGTTVPGWSFNAVLINNSSAWGYKMPYPAGNQAACIQNTQIFSQWIKLNIGTYSLSFYACGRPGGANKINVYCGNTNSKESNPIIFTFTPSTSAWQLYTTNITITTAGNYALGFYGTNTSGDMSSAIQNIKFLSTGTNSNGTYTYEMCKQSAINAGYKYFGLQNVNTSTSKGYCAVSNSEPTIKRLGASYVPTGMFALWSSKTQNQTGNTATLTISGTLDVLNSGGQAIFSTTPGDKVNAGGYLGCFRDTSNRAMPNTSNGQYLPLEQCKQLAVDKKLTYYGTQNANGGNNGWCSGTNDFSSATKYGIAKNCSKNSQGNFMGGPWSNAVYSIEQNGTYFLMLQDDGNMCIYRGTNPTNNQGLLWSSNTIGKQQKPNPNYTAEKGKYGKNWIAQGSTLAAGDFVGSTNGNLALIMQSDGNLVLYTFTNTINCKKMYDTNYGGGVNANAIYDIGQVGLKNNMSKVAFIDENSKLHAYPSNNTQYSRSYTKIKGNDSIGHDISGQSFGNATVESCQTKCNNNSKCAGFSFTAQNVCYPKDSTMYPNGDIQINNNTDLYIRSKIPISPPIGVSTLTNDTNSIIYQNYINGGGLDKSYGLSKATSLQKQQLSQLQTKMNLLSGQISNLTTKLGTGTNLSEDQSKTNVKGLDNYLKNLDSTNTKITNFPTSMDNILGDSDIVVLQKNYDYLFWTILATGTVLVSMNIVKQ
jgi:hypothetical protein